jgi:hypothetical protein
MKLGDGSNVTMHSTPECSERAELATELCARADPSRKTVSSEHPRSITTICKNGLTASISVLYVFLTDKGDEAGVHPYNRILARA